MSTSATSLLRGMMEVLACSSIHCDKQHTCSFITPRAKVASNERGRATNDMVWLTLLPDTSEFSSTGGGVHPFGCLYVVGQHLQRASVRGSAHPRGIPVAVTRMAVLQAEHRRKNQCEGKFASKNAHRANRGQGLCFLPHPAASWQP
jgi:hypothetical protein